jgi:hypothetical protein
MSGTYSDKDSAVAAIALRRESTPAAADSAIAGRAATPPRAPSRWFG